MVKPLIRVHVPLPTAAGVSEANRYVYSTLLSLDQEAGTAERTAPKTSPAWDSTTTSASTAARTGTTRSWFSTSSRTCSPPTQPISPPRPTSFGKRLTLLRHRNFWGLFCIRDDYLASLDPYLRPMPTRFHLDLLDVSGALEAIRKPTGSRGVIFDAAAASRLVDELRQVRVSLTRTADAASGVARVLGPYVEPVLLQVVCRRLWNEVGPAHTEIGLEDVEGLKDVDEALVDFYEQVVKEAVLEPAAGARVSERQVREWVEQALITEQKTRNFVPMGDPTTRGLDNSVVRRLMDRWLVRREQRLSDSWIELSHDRLIEPILRSNDAWRQTNAAGFQKKMREWLSQRRSNSRLLLGAFELREAERWAADHRDVISDDEREFLETCRRALDVECRANLADLGWGVIFAHDADPAVREALRLLLDRRKVQAGDRYKELVFGSSNQPVEDAQSFIARHDAATDVADYRKLPYYLLIVGPPTRIPFEFQYDLDVPYAVGRLSFDSAIEYARYAASVVRAETGKVIRPRRVALFGPQHPADRLTKLSANSLIKPLAERLSSLEDDWDVVTFLRVDATKATMGRLLGDEAPSLLFSATLVANLRDADGGTAAEVALVCQEWPGFSSVTAAHSFASTDVPDGADLGAMIAFFFGGSTAGTPEFSSYPEYNRVVHGPEADLRIAPAPFVNRLPQRLLGHSGYSALAVIGHVDAVFGYSLMKESDRTQPAPEIFEGTIRRLMAGHTVGSAVELLNQRYARQALRLAEELRRLVLKSCPRHTGLPAVRGRLAAPGDRND